MKSNNSFILCFVLTVILLSGCSNIELEQEFTENDVSQLSSSNDSFVHSQKLKYISNSSEVVKSSVPFTLVKAFIPDEKYINEYEVKNEGLTYLTLEEGETSLKGDLVVENGQEEEVDFKAMFMQGDTVSEVKAEGSKKWSKVLQYEVPPQTSVRLPVEIKIKRDAMQELSFIPIDSYKGKEDVANEELSNHRFFLQLGDVSIGEEAISEQSFTLTKNQLSSINNYFPTPYWAGQEGEKVQFKEDEGELLPEEAISGVTLSEIPYSTSVDLVVFDEFGNSKVLKSEVPISKNQEKYVEFDKGIVDSLNELKGRQFLKVTSNREESILSDMRMVKENKKPFPTAYQSIIEFHPNSNK